MTFTFLLDRYKGQITSPPCSEIVSWRVFDEPLKITKRQLKQLAKLLGSYVDSNCENASGVSPTGEAYRPLEEINHDHQVVTHCTNENFLDLLYPPHML